VKDTEEAVGLSWLKARKGVGCKESVLKKTEMMGPSQILDEVVSSKPRLCRQGQHFLSS
jgi:hypothetical protein